MGLTRKQGYVAAALAVVVGVGGLVAAEGAGVFEPHRELRRTVTMDEDGQLTTVSWESFLVWNREIGALGACKGDGEWVDEVRLSRRIYEVVFQGWEFGEGWDEFHEALKDGFYAPCRPPNPAAEKMVEDMLEVFEWLDGSS